MDIPVNFKGLATKKIVINKNVLPELQEFILQNFGSNAKGCIICDDNTYKAAENMIDSLTKTVLCEVVKLDIKSHHADEFMLEDCEKALENKSFDYFIAAGAGTIHDITRVAAHKRNVQFISYPTAPSVDGFVSGIAPVTTKSGMKGTLPAVAPVALFADIDVLAKAPQRLAASGVGDILGKYIALADWRISNLLTGEYIDEPTVELEYDAVDKIKDSLINYGKSKNSESYEKLCADLLDALVLSGLCMQYVGNTRPASGAEHHLSHFWEMNIILSTEGLHGENVGLGSVLCADLYHSFAKSDNIKFTENYNIDEDLIKKYYKNLYGEIIEENAPNSVNKVTSEIFYNNLDKIKALISEIPSKEEFAELLGILGGVNDLKGLKAYNLKCGADEIVSMSFKLAPYVRDRLTLLKLMRCIEI